MRATQFDITLNGYLPSLLIGLENDGVNVQKYLNHRYLKKLDLYDPNCYIPNVLLEDFLVNIKNDLGVESLSKDLSQHFRATKMGKYSQHIFQSPNLYTLLTETIKYQKFIRSNYEAKLEIFGPNTKFSVKIIEAQSEGKLICETIDIMRILDALTLVGGKYFIPKEIGITGKNAKNLETILPKGNYTLKTNQEESWVLFNTSLLNQKIPNILDVTSLDSIIKSTISQSFKVEMILDSFKVGNIPNMDDLAIMFNISRRTLERMLRKEGSSFSIIKQKYLQRKSIDLLINPYLSINEIAQNLNYSNSQNFIRVFKKWTGYSPQSYRDLM